MPSSPGTVSKILWHFTGGPKWDEQAHRQSTVPKPIDDAYKALVGILSSKELRVGQYKERLDVTMPELHRHGLGETERDIVQHSPRGFLFKPVCCLADIPIIHLGYHANRYGKIAIGYCRQSVLRAGFSPVFYQLHNSIALRSLFQVIMSVERVGGRDPGYKYEPECEEPPSNESYDEFRSKTNTEALIQARRSAIKLGAFIKTFHHGEFETIYTEREWRSLHPFKFEYDDVAMIVLPRDRGHFGRFVTEAEAIGIPRTVPIVAWEDLVEH